MAKIERTVLAPCNIGGETKLPGDRIAVDAAQLAKLSAAGCVHEADADEKKVDAAALGKGRQEIDFATGNYTGGQPIKPSAREFADRLKDRAAIARDQLNNDKLFDSTVDQLKDLAKAEDIDLTGASKKEEIVGKIREARAAKAQASASTLTA